MHKPLLIQFVNTAKGTMHSICPSNPVLSHSELPSAVTLHATYAVRQVQLVDSEGAYARKLSVAASTAQQLQVDLRHVAGSKYAVNCFCCCSKRASAAQEEDTHKAFCAAAAGQFGSNGPSGPCWLAITYLQPHTWQSIFC